MKLAAAVPGRGMARRLVALALLASPALGASAVAGGDFADTSLLQDAAGERDKPATQRRLLQVTVDYNRHSGDDSVTIAMDRTTMTLRAVGGTNPGKGIAWAVLGKTMDKTGWDSITVEATDNGGVSNTVKAYSAGFAEGLLTAPRMSQFYSNFFQLLVKDSKGSAALTNIKNMFYREITYVKKKAGLLGGPMAAEPVDPYWKQVRYLFVQMWGLMDGYNTVAGGEGVKPLDLNDMFVINSHADLAEMMEAYTPDAVKSRSKFQALAALKDQAAFLQQQEKPLFGGGFLRNRGRKMTALEADHDWENRLAKHGHCSALVKVAAETKDLFVGHTTWNDYSKMTRLYKYYKFPLAGSGATVKMMGFSSYPGCVSSTDSFYEMDNGLTVLDTSLEILNPQVYMRVPEFPSNPHYPGFMHVMAVNRLAKTGPHWTSMYSSYNSGLNSAQWLVIDYNLFHPGTPIKPNTLRLLEQVPGLIHESDISHELATKRYWASYNRPYFADVRKITGHTAAEAEYGALYSYAASPRAAIFARSAPSINTLFNMRSMMNSNKFPNEGVLPSEPGHAVSARLDLTADRLPNGGIDSKITNYCLFRALQVQAISGPTHADQPVFKWRNGATDLFPGWPHMGMPDVWNFDWVQMTPSGVQQVIDMQDC